MDLKLLLAFLLGMVVLLVCGMVVYIAYEHPAAANPVMAGGTVLAPLVTVALVIVCRQRS